MIKKFGVREKWMVIGVMAFIALFSMTVLTRFSTSIEVHRKTIEILDQKKMEAMELTAAVAASSSVVAAMPGDATTAISSQLAKLTTPLMLIVCTIYLEKFLLTTIGFVSFGILIPLSCGLGIGALLLDKKVMGVMGLKIAIFGLIISLIVPISAKITSLIEETYQESIHMTFNAADELVEEVENAENKNAFADFFEGIGEFVSDLGEKAEDTLSVFMDAIAVLIITTCGIPMAVIFSMIWLIRVLFDFKIDISKRLKKE